MWCGSVPSRLKKKKRYPRMRRTSGIEDFFRSLGPSRRGRGVAGEREKTAETGKKASQPKEETGRLWDQKTKGPRKRGRKKGANPNVCGALNLKTVGRGTAHLRSSALISNRGLPTENTEYTEGGVGVFNHGCQRYQGCPEIRELSALSG